MNLSDRIESLFLKIQKPVRYMGGEYGAVMKDANAVDVRYAFLFPDTYEVVMSHLVRARVHPLGGYVRRDARQ